MRAVLYMGALSASRHNPLIRAFYQALTACMRKLLVILNAAQTPPTSTLCPYDISPRRG